MPFDKLDLLSRLETFKPLNWFSKPECSKLIYPKTSLPEHKDRAGRMFAEQLIIRHAAHCPWRKLSSPRDLLLSPSPSEPEDKLKAVHTYLRRVQRLSRLDRLPELSEPTLKSILLSCQLETLASLLKLPVSLLEKLRSNIESKATLLDSSNIAPALSSSSSLLPSSPPVKLSHDARARILAALGWDVEVLHDGAAAASGPQPAQYSLLHLGVQKSKCGLQQQQQQQQQQQLSSASVALCCSDCKVRAGLWNFLGPRPPPVGRVTHDTQYSCTQPPPPSSTTTTATIESPSPPLALITAEDAALKCDGASSSVLLSMTIAGGGYKPVMMSASSSGRTSSQLQSMNPSGPFGQSKPSSQVFGRAALACKVAAQPFGAAAAASASTALINVSHAHITSSSRPATPAPDVSKEKLTVTLSSAPGPMSFVPPTASPDPAASTGGTMPALINGHLSSTASKRPRPLNEDSSSEEVAAPQLPNSHVMNTSNEDKRAFIECGTLSGSNSEKLSYPLETSRPMRCHDEHLRVMTAEESLPKKPRLSFPSFSFSTSEVVVTPAPTTGKYISHGTGTPCSVPLGLPAANVNSTSSATPLPPPLSPLQAALNMFTPWSRRSSPAAASLATTPAAAVTTGASAGKMCELSTGIHTSESKAAVLHPVHSLGHALSVPPPSDTFDGLGYHRPWCPFVYKETPCTASATSSATTVAAPCHDVVTTNKNSGSRSQHLPSTGSAVAERQQSPGLAAGRNRVSEDQQVCGWQWLVELVGSWEGSTDCGSEDTTAGAMRFHGSAGHSALPLASSGILYDGGEMGGAGMRSRVAGGSGEDHEGHQQSSVKQVMDDVEDLGAVEADLIPLSSLRSKSIVSPAEDEDERHVKRALNDIKGALR
ncbi:hypothetical protein CEUSTIGMA_g11357.t1 [Chlamydomonas eustigma]|uniref:C3HC-type domain-containing protein n=1 Tax=Chlamydomonas eustigma TaxID=1157962 RepID=A0A250XLM9_9CHLO|nr:hypothetical protein CEUSTIGMA_g11357.t1 [Chlamydomonas eustigma]|eukprot:GAX83933.1 hypothetical protein CEUSTIGMA_g11357.t1 [Chlamydomonas eustigma]